MGSEETRPHSAARTVTRRSIMAMAVGGTIASLLGIALGVWIDWFPDQGSTQAAAIDTLWDVLVIASVPVFVLVATIVLAAVRLFRQRPGEEGLDGPPIHGSTKLEVAWTAAPTALIIGLCAYAWVVLVDIEDAPADNRPELAERRIQVIGEQFTWTFRYNEGGKRFSSNRLHLPAGESVRFDVTSKDVIHDFWVPDFRMKIDAVPGVTTGFRVTPRTDAVGEHEIVCAELCGIGHAYMRQTAVVQTPEEFGAWVQRQQRGGGPQTAGGTAQQREAGGAVQDGKAVFTAGNPDTGATACGACHTLADAGTSASTGPNLDETLKGEDAEAVRRMIVEPNADVAEGFGEGIMPANYGETLTEDQLDSLVEYLVEATK